MRSEAEDIGANRDAIFEKLQSLLCGRLKTDTDIQPQTDLEDVGFDSVELAFVLSHFERDTGFSFDDAEVDVSRYTNIEHIVDLLASLMTNERGEHCRSTDEPQSAK